MSHDAPRNPLNVLIVGGYGTFGGRLVELLEDDPRLTLVVAGRSLQNAQSYCAARKMAQARLVPAVFDRTRDLARQLSTFNPDIVVDASGPFQDYGRDGYALIEACIAQGIHYLDLADGSDFVAGVGVFDEAARKADVFVLSGVSSFPVLTNAVVRHLSASMVKVTSICGGIAPSPYAGVGSNVIRAIAGYAGQEITLMQAGKTHRAWPLTSVRRYTISPPGHTPLRNTLFSLVDVPDLRVLAKKWPDANIWMGAGPVPEILHILLILLAWLVRLKIVKSLLPLSGLMTFVMRHMRYGEDRGGMFVVVEGEEGERKTVSRAWHLLAEGRDGPLIPSMTVACMIRKYLAGTHIESGARAALDDMTLNDYDSLFRTRTICTGFREDTPENSLPLYQKILGTAWDQLPPPIRTMHDVMTAAEAEGLASVMRGDHPLAIFACWMLGFPKAGTDIPVTVKFTVKDKKERWVRCFHQQRFHSLQYAGRGRSKHMIVERFGPLSFAMALVPAEGKLNLVLRRWSIFGVSLPMWLCVRSLSYESVDESGRFHFNVHISHRLTGLIIHYKGWLLRKA